MKLAVVSLGCDKNRVDTENLLFYLSQSVECEITEDDSEAEVIVVNTCAFIADARRESIDTILRAAQLKKTGALKKLIVTGCLPQKYADELYRGLPEVDAFLGTRDYDKIGRIVADAQRCRETDGTEIFGPKRILSTRNYAYLKIADGCDNHCTFCTIPSIRGRYVSREMGELKDEAAYLAGEGVSELILVAQDTSRYGRDLYGNDCLTSLIRELTHTDIKRLRLLYCYPEGVTDELIDEIVSNPKVANYIDVPLQHVSDKILRFMNRRVDKKAVVELTEKLKSKNIAMRTTLMTGFPGEEEEDFHELCDYLTVFKPENVGIFSYSREEGTPAYKLKNQVGRSEKNRRKKILGEIAYHNAIERNKALQGRILKVLFERIDFQRGMFVGRSEYEAPEVDGTVYFTGAYAEEGRYYDVEITGSDGYDLIGRLAD